MGRGKHTILVGGHMYTNDKDIWSMGPSLWLGWVPPKFEKSGVGEHGGTKLGEYKWDRVYMLHFPGELCFFFSCPFIGCATRIGARYDYYVCVGDPRPTWHVSFLRLTILRELKACQKSSVAKKKAASSQNGHLVWDS